MIAAGAAQSAEHVKLHILAVFGLPRQTPTPCHPVKPVGAVIEGDPVTTCALAGEIGNSIITIATTSMHHRCAACAHIRRTYHYETDSATNLPSVSLHCKSVCRAGSTSQDNSAASLTGVFFGASLISVNFSMRPSRLMSSVGRRKPRGALLLYPPYPQASSPKMR